MLLAILAARRLRSPWRDADVDACTVFGPARRPESDDAQVACQSTLACIELSRGSRRARYVSPREQYVRRSFTRIVRLREGLAEHYAIINHWVV